MGFFVPIIRLSTLQQKILFLASQKVLHARRIQNVAAAQTTPPGRPIPKTIFDNETVAM